MNAARRALDCSLINMCDCASFHTIGGLPLAALKSCLRPLHKCYAKLKQKVYKAHTSESSRQH
jgi:hypothetical protein